MTSPLKVIVLPEATAGCDLACFLVDSNEQPCGVLTIAGCRYGQSIDGKKEADQALKVSLRNQYVQNKESGVQQLQAGADIAKLLDHPECKLRYFVELLVRFAL